MTTPEIAATNAAARAAEDRLKAAAAEQNLPLPLVVEEGRRRFNTALEDELLDYKHNHAVSIEACANTLMRIFSNILDNPDEEKFKKVKSTSNAFKAVTNVKGGEHLIMLAGFKVKVIDMVSYWVFTDGQPGTHKYAILQACCSMLQRGMNLIHEKAARKRAEAEEKIADEKERLAAVQAALEDDRAQRRYRSQVAALSSVRSPNTSPVDGTVAVSPRATGVVTVHKLSDSPTGVSA